MEKGKVVLTAETEDNYSTGSEAEYEYDESQDLINDENELYELRADTVIQVVQPGNVIALFSPPNALELFYLCIVKESGVCLLYTSPSPRDS